MKDNASRQRILRTCRLSMIGMLWLLACAAVWKTWNRLPTSSPPLPTAGSGVMIDPQSASAKPAQLPEFSLINCDGRHIHRSDVLGHPVVLSFIFTKCTSTCPDITRQMRALHERLSDTDTLFVTITVDPKRDTAEILKRYAESNAADLNRWLFLTGEPEAIYELINDGFGLAAQELFGEQRQPGLEVAHTNRVVLVGRDGQIQATYLATNPDDIARLQIQLKQLARPADSEPPPEESSPAGLDEDADAGCGASTQADPLETAQTSEAAQPALLPDWPLQGIADFQLQECHGRTITRDNLLGRQSIVCFIFTRCAGPCPQVSLRMRELQDRLESKQQLAAFGLPLPLNGGAGQLLADSLALADQIALDRIPEFHGDRIRLITITVDPQHDTPEVLRAYAATFDADPDRWWFLTGEQQAIYDLTTQSFRQIVEELSGEDRRPGFEVIHTTNLLHLDALGRVRGKYNSRKEADISTLRRTLTTGRMRSDRDPVMAAIENSLAPEKSSETGQPRDTQPPPAPTATDSAQDPDMAPVSVAKDPFPATVPDWVRNLPRINALLNGTATVLLLAGFVWIRRGQRRRHQWAMLLAFATSIVFLGCYVTYHLALRNYTGSGSIRFLGTGWIRPLYFTILLTHVVLAAAVPVLTSITIWRAMHARWDAHRKIARITFPIWLYVSVTGVMIYAILYHWPVSG